KEHACARRPSRPRSLPQGRGSGPVPVGARLRAKALATRSLPQGRKEHTCAEGIRDQGRSHKGKGGHLCPKARATKVAPTRTKGAHLRPKAFATKLAPTGAGEWPCGSAL